MAMQSVAGVTKEFMRQSMAARLGAIAFTMMSCTAPGFAAQESQVLFERGVNLMKAGGEPSTVFGLMEQAAALGETRAKLRTAEFKIVGYGTARDAVNGLAELEKLAAEGNGNAMLSTGDAYARGAAGLAEKSKAITYYEQAAATGSSLAFVRLGEIYRDGRGVSPDPVKALDYLNKAVAAGRDGAIVLIGKGIAERKLGKGIPRRNGYSMLEDALSKNNPDAAVALAECNLNGMGVRRNGKAAVSLLRQAMQGGNPTAGRKLVALYRDGHKSGVRRNIATARREFAAIAPQLDQNTLLGEDILLEAAAAPQTLASYRQIEARIRDAGPLETPGLVRKLKSVNLHAYVFMVQGQLKSLGYHPAKVSGRLDRSTVKAMYRYCIERERKAACRQGPMTNTVTDVLVTAF